MCLRLRLFFFFLTSDDESSASLASNLSMIQSLLLHSCMESSSVCATLKSFSGKMMLARGIADIEAETLTATWFRCSLTVWCESQTGMNRRGDARARRAGGKGLTRLSRSKPIFLPRPKLSHTLAFSNLIKANTRTYQKSELIKTRAQICDCAAEDGSAKPREITEKRGKTHDCPLIFFKRQAAVNLL